MAVSKIWPLYQTLDKAIKYICNYEKTEDGTLITTYKCSEKFADYEFQDIYKKARRVNKSRIAYHTMLSFSPEDNITPQRALELGEKIIDEYFGGRFQYVLTVHTDQNHLHVHCISNSVNYEDFTKFHIKDKDLKRLEIITDNICRENQLSVIEKKSGVKGRGKYEYGKHKESASWKDKLRAAIDRNILLADNYEDFLNRMQMEEGYEVKQGKYLSFTLVHEGQKKAVRNRSLGEDYSIDRIKERIANKEKQFEQIEPKVLQQKENAEETTDSNDTSIDISSDRKFETNVKRLIDISQSKKAKEYAAYGKKLSLINISTYAGMMKFVEKYRLVYASDFENARNELEFQYTSLTSEVKKTYAELNNVEATVWQLKKYFDNKEAYDSYISTTDKDEKYSLSEAYKKYKSALYYFKKNNIGTDKLTLQNLEKQINKMEKLSTELEKLKGKRKEIKSDLNQLAIVQKNNADILGNTANKENKNQNSEREK